jgi:SH3-like domain-containing protein
VKILNLGEGWTQVRTSDGTEGWVSAGFLEPEPPAVVVLENLKGQTEKMAATDDGQRSDIDR